MQPGDRIEMPIGWLVYLRIVRSQQLKLARFEGASGFCPLSFQRAHIRTAQRDKREAGHIAVSHIKVMPGKGSAPINRPLRPFIKTVRDFRCAHGSKSIGVPSDFLHPRLPMCFRKLVLQDETQRHGHRPIRGCRDFGLRNWTAQRIYRRLWSRERHQHEHPFRRFQSLLNKPFFNRLRMASCKAGLSALMPAVIEACVQ